MYEAAELFARQGYHGTTTREIAGAVGIRQPSLFHHFGSKQAIVEAILNWDLGVALPRVRVIADQDEPAPERLYRYLQADVTHLATAPYNLSGVYAEEVIGSPEFSSWAQRRDELHDIVEGIVRDGIAQGDFIAVDSNMVRHAIGGILVRVLTIHSGGRGTVAALAEDISRLLLRALLSDPRQMDGIAYRAMLGRDNATGSTIVAAESI